jgi:hypothetical protein
MDEEDETVVAGHRQQLGAGAGAISDVAVVETHAVIYEAILPNGEVTTEMKRQWRDRRDLFREETVEGVDGVEVAGVAVVVSTKVAAALLVIKIILSTTLVP